MMDFDTMTKCEIFKWHASRDLRKWICEKLYSKVGSCLGFLSRISMYGHENIAIIKSAYVTARWKYRLRYCGQKTNLGVNTRFFHEQGISIGRNTRLGQQCIMETQIYSNCALFQKLEKTGELIIGNDCNIGDYNHFTAMNKIEIGDGLLTGRFVLITDNAHGDTNNGFQMKIPPSLRDITSKGPVVIGKNVWLGDKVTVLSGVSIGDGVVIASNAVVTCDIPSYCIAAGVPARVIKTLSLKD